MSPCRVDCPLDGGDHSYPFAPRLATLVENRLRRRQDFPHHSLHSCVGPGTVGDGQIAIYLEVFRRLPYDPISKVTLRLLAVNWSSTVCLALPRFVPFQCSVLCWRNSSNLVFHDYVALPTIISTQEGVNLSEIGCIADIRFSAFSSSCMFVV